MVARDILGVELKPWQQYAANRITEHKDGELVWPFALLTVGRQQGKTVLLAALVAWRLLRGPELFGEPQRILSMAQKTDVARLIWDQVVPDRLEHDAAKVEYRTGAWRLDQKDGSVWRVTGSRLTSVTGFSTSLAVIDEAYAVDRDVVVAGVFPQTIQRTQPQVVMCSTAGDTRSDLMAHYRDQAREPRSEVLQLEWSAPPDSDPHDETTWRWSLPDWRPQVYRRLHGVTGDAEWRREYLNQWVVNRDGWIDLTTWLECASDEPMPEGGMVVAGPSRDYASWSAVHAAMDPDGVTHVRHMRAGNPDKVWRWVHDLGDEVSFHVNVGTRFREPDWLRPASGTVGVRELHAAIRLVQNRINSGGVRHVNDETFTEHVMRASVTDLPGGTTVMRSPTAEPIDLTEHMVVAVELAGRRGKVPTLA